LANHLVANPGSIEPPIPPSFHLESLPLSAEELRKITRIVIIAQGTAFHAGLVGRNMIERTARISVSVEYGSDFRYRDPVIDPSVMVIAVSQSGETADTLGAVRLARERGCKTLAVINAEGSTIARESDGVIYMHCGPEIGVASTKAFTAQIAALYVLAIHLGMLRNLLSTEDAVRRVEDLLQVPGRVEEILDRASVVEAVARKYKDATNALFLGRGTGFPLALEGALKLKEISYIHAEGYDAAEMKHGPIALIDEKMPVIFLVLRGRRYDKIVSNIQEVKARGGRVIAIASHDDKEIYKLADDVIPIYDDRGIMNSIVCSVPLQLFAYYIATMRGCDVDKPRNLAKSVTVE
jgi:glucosamine--fructose-6-phosphate aminotransferase (isomerizing)